ncbi:MAG: apolipoprotein N-acyltransferase [Thermodesulfobacteriota bacterium]
MKKISARQISAALLSGCLLFAASPGFAGLAPVAWLALVPLLTAISKRTTSPRQAALFGLISGFAYYPLLLYWITIVLGRYGNLPLWLSIPALLLLSLYMSLYLAGFAALSCHLQKRHSLIWIAPTVWVALDFLRGWLFTGFPWFDLAYTQFQTPLLIQIADITGHHGVSFMIVMINTLIFHAFRNYHKQHASKSVSDFSFRTAILLVLIILSYSLIKFNLVEKQLAASENLGVAVIQGNISQEQKWLPKFQRQTLGKYLELSSQIIEQEKPALIVWPETALPFYLKESGLLKDITSLTASRPGLTILTGAPHREKSGAGSTTKYFNSAFFIDGDGLRSERYDKQHLVPFGEYVPLKSILPFLAPLVETVADFTPGTTMQPVPCQNARVGVLICFESIFPTLARQQTKAGSELLVNLTNDAWYGRSGAPWQHLSMAVFRAVENRRSLARAANTGVSGFIDPLGRMHELSPLFEDFSAYHDLPIVNIKSVFTFYGGHQVGLLCLLITTILSILTKRTSKFDF